MQVVNCFNYKKKNRPYLILKSSEHHQHLMQHLQKLAVIKKRLRRKDVDGFLDYHHNIQQLVYVCVMQNKTAAFPRGDDFMKSDTIISRTVGKQNCKHRE